MVYSYLLEECDTINEQLTQQVWQPFEPQAYTLPIFLAPEFVHQSVISEITHMMAKRFKLQRSKMYAFFKISDVELELPVSEFFRHLREGTFPDTVFETPPPRSEAEKMKADEELYGTCCHGGPLKPTCCGGPRFPVGGHRDYCRHACNDYRSIAEMW